MAYSGMYHLHNEEKYKGTTCNGKIKYLSLWERTVMKFFDNSSSILSWMAPTGNKDLCIPYISPKDNRQHLYYPDFIILAKTNDGKEKVTMIEVKPLIQTLPPKQPQKKSRKYFARCATYAINISKWAAATKFCQVRNWEFKILTEKNIYGNS
jgi:hypothetical protein